MNRLVLHHFYTRSAFDLSDNRNHGVPVDVALAGPPDAPAFVFADGNSDVRVPPSPTLQDLWSVRATVTFSLEPPAGQITRRYNLMEGHLSFALFVTGDGALMGTILDQTGAWTGATSIPDLVSTSAWHTAELQHDGINALRIFLDGAQVGAAFDAPGPVRSVGPHGVAIGHWPEQPGTYTFVGAIREAKLWKYDPHKDANGLLDACCDDQGAIDAAVARLRRKGETAESVEATARDILGFAVQLSAQVRGGDQATTEQHQALSNAATTAFIRGDQASYTAAAAQLAQLSIERLTPAQMAALQSREEELVKGLPLPLDELTKLVGALCWDRVGLDPPTLAAAIEQLGGVGQRQEKPGKAARK